MSSTRRPTTFYGMLALMRRLGIQASDSLQHNGLLRHGQALTILAASTVAGSAVCAQARSVAAFQRAESPRIWRWFGRRCRQSNDQLPEGLSPIQPVTRYSRHVEQQSQLTRSLILKAPGAEGERGVLLVQFEYNWFRLLHGVEDLNALSEEYDILWGTSWSPTDYALLATVLSRTMGEVHVLPSHASEVVKLQAFDRRIHCPPVLSACDWVNPAFFAPKPHDERTTDILMVANWAPFKRHFELFNALRRMPAELRVTLIGQPEGKYTADHIRRMLDLYRVPQEVTLLERLPIEEVTRHQCDAKTALVLSRREGSCVAAVEALFAGAALGMRHGAHVGALQYVNDKTGALISGQRTARDLMVLLEKSASLNPQKWAAENISCHLSLAKLERFLRERAASNGRPWKSGLTPYHWRPYPAYIKGEDQRMLTSAYQNLHRRFPQVFTA